MKLKLKSTLFAGVLAATMAVPAFASNAPNNAPVVEHLPQFTAADTHMLFEQDAMPMQLATLSQLEMQETEGARFNFRPVINVWRNTKFDGYNPGTGRIFQVRYNGPPVFRIDYAPNPSPTTLHFHLPPNMNAHRPWYAPWRQY